MLRERNSSFYELLARCLIQRLFALRTSITFIYRNGKIFYTLAHSPKTFQIDILAFVDSFKTVSKVCGAFTVYSEAFDCM